MSRELYCRESGRNDCKVDFIILGPEHCMYEINFLYRTGKGESEYAKGYKEKFIEIIEKSLTK